MRKRSHRKPRPILADPLRYVLDSIQPVASHDSYLVDLKIINHSAMDVLLKGHATKKHLDVLIAMHNIMEAIQQMTAKGVLTDLPVVLDSSTLIRGKAALLDLAQRWADTGRFVIRAPELQALNDLMSMHDELMDGHLRVGHMERAIAWARNEIVCRRATVINDLIANKPSAESAIG